MLMTVKKVIDTLFNFVFLTHKDTVVLFPLYRLIVMY